MVTNVLHTVLTEWEQSLTADEIIYIMTESQPDWADSLGGGRYRKMPEYIASDDQSSLNWELSWLPAFGPFLVVIRMTPLAPLNP